MARRLATAALVLTLLGLQYRLWVGDGSVLDLHRQQSAVQDQAAVNADLLKRNAVLEAEVADLRAGGAAIEAHARTTLGMVRKGETFYLVVNSDPK
jgi:cell division protein FtsB